MVLGLEDFAVFQANWQDKAANIRAIAETLELGLEAMVFVDDNPAERFQVRQACPQVSVPEMGDDPTEFSQILLAAGYFESTYFSPEDAKRADLYTQNAKRIALKQQAGSLDSYLLSLYMTLSLEPFREHDLPRVTQLTGKTNQFNLTTRRRSEVEVAAVARDADYLTLQARLQETFGDQGLIAVVIGHRQRETLWLDTWLMSCRVLKRRVEEAVFCELHRRAAECGVVEIRGRYLPTGRNQLVANLLPSLGFQPEGEDLVFRVGKQPLPANLPFAKSPPKVELRACQKIT